MKPQQHQSMSSGAGGWAPQLEALGTDSQHPHGDSQSTHAFSQNTQADLFKLHTQDAERALLGKFSAGESVWTRQGDGEKNENSQNR